jgi:hypothetical protein
MLQGIITVSGVYGLSHDNHLVTTIGDQQQTMEIKDHFWLSTD